MSEELSDLLRDRRDKLQRITDAGIDPFPHEFAQREEIAEVRAAHEGLAPGIETESRHRVAGRLVARRGHGKACFLDLRDGSGQLQLHAREDLLGPEAYALLVELDLGDIVGVEGTAMATRRGGELSLAIDRWRLLAKSLRPPPDKFHGLEDTETRFRRRELDLIANEESRRRFRIRAKTITELRRWLDEHAFVEVETPVLQPLYGGALARPFVTHHNQLDRDFYLRIATELYLKRLVVGGLDRVYELGKDFRNEGVSHKHNPEFTMLEWYEAYADYEKTAHDLELLVSETAERVLGTTVVKRGEVEIDFKPPWRRITLREAILERSGVDIAEHRDREALARAIGGKVDPKEGWGKLVDGLLSRDVEPGLIQPTFVVDYPVELSPFAKAHRSEPGLVERWEAFAGGVEIANSFSELNDPDEQRRRFEQQRSEIE
ncbi:MAG TPA: lysine--tRNA ligase, partial [Solirubrobacterales bacterium]|nr:lysine--tRNA ligase [Solirubrobacterales bacterium]